MELRKQGLMTVACAHHWRIASPDGAFSVGTCAKCGVKREFANSAETTGFGYGRTKPRPIM